jgi:hypothetical protein
VVGIDFFADEVGSFDVVADGLQFFDAESFLFLLFGETVAVGVLCLVAVWDVLDEIFAAEVLVVVVVAHLLVVLGLLLAPGAAGLVELEDGLGTGCLNVPEEFMDSLLSFGGGEGEDIVESAEANSQHQLTIIKSSLRRGVEDQVVVALLLEQQFLPRRDVPSSSYQQFKAKMAFELAVGLLSPGGLVVSNVLPVQRVIEEEARDVFGGEQVFVV